MAKHIKALKCPQCGSVKKQSIKEDHYICNNCGTEYFLDNDDININVKHSYNQNNPLPITDEQKRKIVLIIAIVVGLFIILPTIISLFSRDSSSEPQAYSSPTVEPTETITYYESSPLTLFQANDAQNQLTILMKVVRRNLTGVGREEEHYMRYYDFNSGNLLKEIKMPDWSSDNYLYERKFDDGHYYFLVNKKTQLFKADFQRKTVEDITDATFSKIPELASGIATIKFVSEGEGDGFNIMTNDGKEYYVYPFANQLYKDFSTVRKNRIGLKTLKANPRDSTMFLFTEKSSDYPDEKIQLIKYNYKYNPNYPYDRPYRIKWEKEYQYPEGSGIFVGNFPYKKKLFKEPRITKFKDLTPDRLYFDARVEYQDGKNLIISGLVNANPDGNKVLQKINTETGQLEWTYSELSEKRKIDDMVYAYNKGAIFKLIQRDNPEEGDLIIQLDSNGKQVKTLSLKKLLK